MKDTSGDNDGFTIFARIENTTGSVYSIFDDRRFVHSESTIVVIHRARVERYISTVATLRIICSNQLYSD